MKIQQRISYINWLNAIFFAFITSFYTLQFYSIHNQYTHLSTHDLPIIESVHQLKQSTLRLIASTTEYALLKTESHHGDREISDIFNSFEQEELELAEEGIAGLNKALSDYKNIALSFNFKKNLYIELEPAVSELIDSSNNMIALIDNGIHGIEILEAKESLELMERKVLKLLSNIETIEKNQVNQNQQEINQSIQRLYWLTGLFILIFFALTYLRKRLINRKIFPPLQKLVENINYLFGDKEASFKTPDLNNTDDEISLVYRSLNELLEKNRQTNKKLEIEKNRADKANMAKSLFLANMSHELRTPMHAIHNFANLSLRYTSHEKAERFIQNIRTSAIRLTNLLNNLLDLSKLEAGKMSADFKEQDITLVISNSINEISSLLEEKKISIKFNPDQSYSGMFDQKLMTQVIVNLLSNAIKFSPQTSCISINVSRISKVIENQKPDTIHIEITDQGVGIPAHHLETIFDKFIQSDNTDNTTNGTGLGLSITHEIITLHHGTIHAESPPRGQTKGTSFIVEIPIIQNVLKNQSIVTLDEVIGTHQHWKDIVDMVLNGNAPPSKIPAEYLVNHHLCSFGSWLEKNKTGIEETEKIKHAHKQFHLIAAEVLSLHAVGNTLEARNKQTELHNISDDLTARLQKHS